MNSVRVGRAPGALLGELDIPGDKSISHRGVLFSALASEPSELRGVLDSGDVRASARLASALGCEISQAGATWTVRPPTAWREPGDVVDCGNSGTTMRLALGMLAGRPGFAVLSGDGSLRQRPMRRVVSPLRAMGARLDGRGDGELAPVAVRGGDLHRVTHTLSLASAQVKSALLLAGLGCGVTVKEPRRSRDHTERLLRVMGAGLAELADGSLVLAPSGALAGLSLDVPGDLSSAAFWLVAGCVVPGSRLVLRGVGVNPTRAGVIDALRAMGAELSVQAEGEGAEPVATLTVGHSGLRGAVIDGELALRCLDELPVLAVAAACAEGETVIRDAAELRVKESDRIARVVAGLRALGVQAEELPDGMVIQGGVLCGGAELDCSGDHRLAMAFAVAGQVCEAPVLLRGVENGTSYPGFFQDLTRVGGEAS